MALGGCFSCVKYLMFAFNFLFWLLGCAIIGVGVWIRVDPDFRKFVDQSDMFANTYIGAYILIGVGALVMVIGFLGCCGAIRESQCMLATFFLLLFVIFAILLAAGIWAIIRKDHLKRGVTEMLEESVDRYYNLTDDGKDDSAKAFMDDVQTNFHCCGAHGGAKDYKNNPVPDTCAYATHKNPCDKVLFESFSEKLVIVAGVAIGIGVVMVFGMIFSLYLCCAISRSKRYDSYKYS